MAATFKQITMETNQPVIAVLDNGRGVLGRFIYQREDKHFYIMVVKVNGGTARCILPPSNVFPRTTGGLNDAFQRMMELQLEEAKEAIEDGHELQCNYHFVETCKNICK